MERRRRFDCLYVISVGFMLCLTLPSGLSSGAREKQHFSAQAYCLRRRFERKCHLALRSLLPVSIDTSQVSPKAISTCEQFPEHGISIIRGQQDKVLISGSMKSWIIIHLSTREV